MKIINCQPSRKSSRKNQFIKRVNKSSLPQLLDGFPNDPWQSRFIDVHVVFADNLNAGTDFFFSFNKHAFWININILNLFNI